MVAALRQQQLTLAIGETNTGGLVARRLLEVEGGKEVLAGVRIALDGLTLAQEMGISEPVVNEDTVRVLTDLVREQYAAHLGLVILESVGELPTLHIALAAPDGVHLHQWPSRRHSDVATLWTFHFALDVVRRWLMH